MPETSLPAPGFDCTLLVRTDYSDDSAWQRVVDAIQTPSEDGFTAIVTLVDDPLWENMSLDQLIAAMPHTYRKKLLIVADGYTQTGPGFPLLVADVRARPKRSMRVAAQSLWDVENNLSIANLDWEDYANHTDPDGVFRDEGLSDPRGRPRSQPQHSVTRRSPAPPRSWPGASTRSSATRPGQV